MWIALSIIGGVVLLVALMGLVQRGALRAIAGPLSARVRARYPDEAALLSTDLTANSFGLESKGAFQSRGNGALVVAPDELVFFQYLPERDFVVPLGKILEVTFAHSHLGKATPFRLVKVRFRGEEGPDSLAFMVQKPDELRDRIERARKARRRPADAPT